MTREEATKNIKEHCYFANLIPPAKEALDMAIIALEQQPLEVEAANLQKVYNKGFEDCRQAVLEAIDAKAWEFCDYLISKGRNDEQKPVSHFADNLREYVREELPPVTPMPKEAHWEWNQYDANPEIGNFHCSLCHSIGRSYFDYCPYCGAKISKIPTGVEGSEEE